VPCDWGVTPLTVYSTSVDDPIDVAGTAEYDHGFKEERIFLLLIHRQVRAGLFFSKFTDGVEDTIITH